MAKSFSMVDSPPSKPVSPCLPRHRLVVGSVPGATNSLSTVSGGCLLRHRDGTAVNFCPISCGLKLLVLEKLRFQQPIRRCGSPPWKESNCNRIISQNGDHKGTPEMGTALSDGIKGQLCGRSNPSTATLRGFGTEATGTIVSRSYLPLSNSSNRPFDFNTESQLSIAVIGATGELARRKVFPALFALYYSGFLPKIKGIFGYSRKNLKDDGLRSIIAATLTCRVDHQENCAEKLDDFLSKTYYINGGYDNHEGMAKLNALMGQIEGGHRTNRIFYLSVPQEALLDVAACLAENAKTQTGWNRIIIEKPFGFDASSSNWLTQSLLSNFVEKQIYRIDHLLGRNLIENLTVLRFSNLVFEPLWSRTYIRNVQVILSENLDVQPGRYFDHYGIIVDIIHSHVLQTLALLAMEPPISLDGEDIRNEKVKLLRSIRKVEPSDVILGQYKASTGVKDDMYLNTLTPTYFAAALHIDNARWDGVPFMIRAGMGLMKHQMEIRIQFHHVPGNLYRERIGHNIDLATNELILRDVPDEAILLRVNNKIPGLSLQLDSPELNLLYKDKYNTEVPDSYEHLLHDVIDGDNHLFMRSDEVAASWNILSPILSEIDNKHISPEQYELGGRGPIGAFYLWAKHGVCWAED